jgi:hypothetical protein
MVPALWMIAQACMPETSWEAAVMRGGAVLLAFLGQLTLSLMDTTANDLYAASPLVWAVALGLTPSRSLSGHGWLTPARAIDLSGAASGIAVAFKLSNGPLVLVLPVLWIMVPGSFRQRLGYVLVGTFWSVVAFLLAYGWWGWQLWQYFGNPIYPFSDSWFDPIRQLAGWAPP